MLFTAFFDSSKQSAVTRQVNEPMTISQDGDDAQLDFGQVAVASISIAELRQWQAEVEGFLAHIDAELEV